MKLRFNEGAIVELTLFGNFEPVIIEGKVIEVLEDEVLLCAQMLIYREAKGLDLYWREREEGFDEFCSADSNIILHVNRQLIMSWRYIRANEAGSAGAVGERRGVLDEKFCAADCNLNYYDRKTGFCKGSGKYCGDIEENYVTPILMSIEDSISDELGLDLES